MSQPIFIVDAFTSEAFAGNPAAVCPLEAPADEAWMKNVAREMNLSETAFVHPRVDGDWGIRWFTPAVEVELCGHATLAASHALWESGRVEEDEIRFDSTSGALTATRESDGLIRLDFPALPPRETEIPESLTGSLRGARWFGEGGTKMVALLGDARAVREYVPDLSALKTFLGRGLIVTAEGDEDGIDFVSRFFAPGVGVDEDPVCGSAHCALTALWSGRLGKSAMTARQVSARGGEVRVELRGDRVSLGGYATTTLRGELSEAASAARYGASSVG